MAFLYLTEQGSVLKKTGQRLVVSKEETTLLDIPASKVEAVLVFGNVQITTQAAHLLLEQGIEMALLTSHGRLLGQLTSPATKNVVLRVAQHSKRCDPAFVHGLAQAMVAGKIANCIEFVREFAHNHEETDLSTERARLTALGPEVLVTADLPALLGLEGTAARTYFQAFAKMIRHGFNFEGRRRRPSPDPVNALLSLGYTMVYNEILSLLDGIGFDPYLGFYHQVHYGHATLASDLLEEFRCPLTDRFTLSLINNRIFCEQDFYLHSGSGDVYLKDVSLKRYFGEYERFVTRPVQTTGEGREYTYRLLFRRQAERLKQSLTATEPYRPYRFHW